MVFYFISDIQGNYGNSTPRRPKVDKSSTNNNSNNRLPDGKNVENEVSFLMKLDLLPVDQMKIKKISWNPFKHIENQILKQERNSGDKANTLNPININVIPITFSKTTNNASKKCHGPLQGNIIQTRPSKIASIYTGKICDQHLSSHPFK